MRRPLIALLALAAAPALVRPAWAQPAPARPPATDPDIIGSLLDPNYHPSKAEQDEPDTAAPAAPTDTPVAPAPGRLRRVPFAAPPRPEPGRPVRIEETDRTPDRPPAPRDAAYDARLRASFAAAESYQGPLDGGWTLADERAGDWYALQIVDRRDRLEAAWRDLRARDAQTTSGLVEEISRSGGGLTLRFTDGRGTPIRLSLQSAGEDRWRGDLWRADQRTPVTLRRTGP